MKYIAAIQASELAAGSMTSVTVESKQILLANVAGAYHAIGQKCPHMGADLCKGSLAGPIVTCPKHGAAFNVADGTAVGPAKILFLKMKPKGATTYPVKIENGQILIGV